MSEAVSLVLRPSADTLVAFPAEHVVETMRPLDVSPVVGAPELVVGVAVVRGRPIPIVDMALLLGSGRAAVGSSSSAAHLRWVTVRVGTRRVGLQVAEVIGLRRLPAAVKTAAAAPLLRGLARGTADALSVLDGELLVVLDTARILGPELWRMIEKTTEEPHGA